MSLLAMIAAAWAFCASQTAHAIVIWDQSPAAVGGTVTGTWQNISSMQNFTDEVFFTSDVVVQGMDIYTAPAFATLGKAVTIRVRIGSPDGTLQEFVDDIDLIDADGTTDTQTQVRAHATFPQPITLLGGTIYWFGMSGFPNPGGFSELGQLAIQSGAGPLLDGQMAQYSGTGFTFNTQVGDMAFRLDGNPANGVPEPGTLALLGLATAGIGLMRRRRFAS